MAASSSGKWTLVDIHRAKGDADYPRQYQVEILVVAGGGGGGGGDNSAGGGGGAGGLRNTTFTATPLKNSDLPEVDVLKLIDLSKYCKHCSRLLLL
jgi:hypothetical protein